jgi:hypothetical protein
MNQYSTIFSQISKIADIDPQLISTVSRQMSKIAEINPESVDPILKQLIKITEINSKIVESVIRQLSKIAEINSSNIVEIISQMVKALTNYPEYQKNLVDSLSDSQIYSKNWIVEILQGKELGNVLMCAGWYAMILTDNRFKFTKCVSIDLDPLCEKVSKILHKKLVIDSWKFQAVTDNIHNINYSGQYFTVSRSDGTTVNMFLKPDTIINTSCEHIENFDKWYELVPSDKLLILQTNNGFGISDHINCVSSLEEFEKQTPMKIEIYSGEKEMPKFTRFMRIGYK